MESNKLLTARSSHILMVLFHTIRTQKYPPCIQESMEQHIDFHPPAGSGSGDCVPVCIQQIFLCRMAIAFTSS
jgi:hypothetical protein